MADNEILPTFGSNELLSEVTHESVAKEQKAIVKPIDECFDILMTDHSS